MFLRGGVVRTGVPDLPYIYAAVFYTVLHPRYKFAYRTEHLFHGLALYELGCQYHVIVLSGGDISIYTVFALNRLDNRMDIL